MELAERAADLGYPMTRVAISKIEGNSRAGKLDVAELLVLAAVLHIPPALLLAPDFPDGKVETRPGHSVDSREAVAWFSGRGTELVAADALAVEAGKRLSQMRDSLARPDLTPENATCCAPTWPTPRTRWSNSARTSNARKPSCGAAGRLGPVNRQQLPPQIKKIEVLDRKAGKPL